MLFHDAGGGPDLKVSNSLKLTSAQQVLQQQQHLIIAERLRLLYCASLLLIEPWFGSGVAPPRAAVLTYMARVTRVQGERTGE